MIRKTWEYHTRRLTSDLTLDQTTAQLDAAGSDGWELVAVAVTGVCIFKRPLFLTDSSGDSN